jgi:arsenate reductase (glutaredoxin)
MIVYHNPRCSKSREMLELLKKNKCEFEIREYLKNPPSTAELEELLKQLGCKPLDLVRQKEELYIRKYRSKKISNKQWLKILSENPILIERPIVISGKKAIIGRPTELVLDLIKK